MRPDARCYVLVGLLALSLLVASPALAESALDEIPTTHWSYAALNYLQAIGELEGFPEGYFDPDSGYSAEHGGTRTRYELAVGVARALDGLEQGDFPPHVASLANDLGVGFADQIHYGMGGERWPVDEEYQLLAHDCGWAVPPNHWAYNAISYLAEQGLLEQAEYIDFDYPHTLIEFGLAISRLEDGIENVSDNDPDKLSYQIMFETLRAEFSITLGTFGYPIDRQSSPLVPEDHWAYAAMDYLWSIGVSARFIYVIHEKQGNARRYDFAEAADELCEILNEMDRTEDVYLLHLRSLADDLSKEFGNSTSIVPSP